MDQNDQDLRQIKVILERFQEGYTLRDVEAAASFTEEFYSEHAYVLGTGTGELFLGREEIVELIRDDWNYWGDVRLHTEEPYIKIEQDVAWISVKGTVKYSFEDTPARYESYLNFIRKKLEDSELTAKQKVTFLNWALTLTYHQREEKKREYLWPLTLSGVLKKTDEQWRFVQQHFSISVADYPDERLEASKDYLQSYEKQNALVSEYHFNELTEKEKQWMQEFEQALFGQEVITEEGMERWFQAPEFLIVGPEHREYSNPEQIREFFEGFQKYELSLSTEQAIITKEGKHTWITVTGILHREFKEEDEVEQTLQILKELTESEAPSENKIFMIQRRLTYLMKELSFGGSYSYPVRLSMVLFDNNNTTGIQLLHMSYPSYWVFEGKLNGLI